MKFQKLASLSWLPGFGRKFEEIPERFRSQKLHETELTVAWVISSLRQKDKEFGQKHGGKVPKMVTAFDVSEGKGLFSVVLKIGLEFEDSVYYTIVKIPGTFVFDQLVADGKEGNFNFDQSTIDNVMVPMHNNECAFYTHFAHLVPEMLPAVFSFQEWKFYKNQLGYIHMIDLSIKGKNLDYYNCLTHGQVKNVIRRLAHFHKTIMTLDGKQWQGKFVGNKDLMSGLTPGLKQATDKFKSSCKQPGLFTEVFKRDNFFNLVTNPDFAAYAYHQSYLDYGIPTLLVHGDLWTSNIMFKVDSSGYATDEVEAIIDWQVAHEGNFLIDFVRLLMVSCDGDVRRELDLYILDFYIDCLHAELQKTAVKVPFTSEQLRKAYDILFLIHSGHYAIVGPMIFSVKSTKPGEESVDKARQDKSELRGLHIYEDAIKIMDSGDYSKWMS